MLRLDPEPSILEIGCAEGGPYLNHRERLLRSSPQREDTEVISLITEEHLLREASLRRLRRERSTKYTVQPNGTRSRNLYQIRIL